jgi:membrane protein required for beta-lactamase induction
MSLIAILLSLIAERFLGSMAELRRFGWFHRYARLIKKGLSNQRYLNGSAAILLLLAPILAVTGLVDYYLSNLWFLFGLAFAVLVLLFSFGPTDLEAEVEAFVDARERDDEESAIWHAAELLGGELPTHSAQLTRRIMDNILVEANERILAIVFWFVLLGPTGALLFRLTQQLIQEESENDDDFADAARRLHHLLAWPPARVCALAYALAGSFVDSIQAWRNEPSAWPESTRRALIAAGLGALRYEDGEIEEGNDAQNLDMVHETLSLVRRAVLVVISIIALFTLAGWMA